MEISNTRVRDKHNYKKQLTINLSIKKIYNNSKKNMSIEARNLLKYKYKKLTLEEVKNELSENTSYSAFEYKNGNFGIEQVLPIFNVLVLDIDDTNIPIYIMKEKLKKWKYIITTTSNIEDKYKYRILLPLNYNYTASEFTYREIIKGVSNMLNVKIDSSFKAQTYLSYRGSDISLNDGKDIDCFNLKNIYKTALYKGQYLEESLEIIKYKEKEGKDEKYKKNKKQKIREYINQAQNYTVNKNRNDTLYKIGKQIIKIDENINKEELYIILKEVNDSWSNSLEDTELKTIAKSLTKQKQRILRWQ